MFLKLFICCSIAVAVSAMPRERGACVVMCSPGVGIYEGLGLADCPTGQACHSTGCGAMCYHVDPVAVKRTQCGWILCAYCGHGYEKDENGCDTCTCKKPGTDVVVGK